jgi:hypothetical protein
LSKARFFAEDLSYGILDSAKAETAADFLEMWQQTVCILPIQRGGEMTQVTLQAAQSHLSELIERLTPGEGVTITKDDRPVARLVFISLTETPRPVPGRC